MIKGIIVGHSGFGKAVLKAIQSISGRNEHIECFSNDGLSTNELTDEIKALCEGECEDGVIVFVDVFGGSCWRAAKMTRLSNSHIISGFNLPMILSFINKRETIPFDELVSVIESDGKRAIVRESEKV